MTIPLKEPQPAPTTRAAPSRAVLLVAGAAIAAGALIMALSFSGAAQPRALADPGALVRWALPAATTVHHLAMATTLGALVLAATVLPPHSPKSTRTAEAAEHPAFARTMAVASAAAVVWTLAAVSIIVLGYADTIGEPISGSEAFAAQLAYYTANVVTGQTWLAVSLIAAVVATLAFGVRSVPAVAFTAGLTATAIIPLSLTGHVAGSDEHNSAVTALGLHLLGVSLWAGGVIVLGLIAGPLTANRAGFIASLDRDTPGSLPRAVLARFSVLAGAAFALVFISGILNTVYRLDGWDGLASSYGVLIIVKTAATLVLGVIGYLHRAWLARGHAWVRQRHVWQLIAVETLIMAAVMAVAVALARTPPPVPREREPAATPANVLTGYDLPPELGFSSWVSQWRWDWLWVAVATTAAVLYIRGIHRHRRSGSTWPARRLIAWLSGLILLVYLTSGAPAVYGSILASIHITGLLLLTLAVPLLLAAGRPHQLASMVLPDRRDGTTGWNEASAAWANSRIGTALSHPIVATVVTVAALGLFYYTPVFGLALNVFTAQEMANVVFLIVGLCFAQPVLRANPAGTLALFVLAAGLTLWAIFVAVSPTVLQPDWFGALDRNWGPALLVDQQRASIAILLAGVAPVLATLIIRLLRNHGRAAKGP